MPWQAVCSRGMLLPDTDVAVIGAGTYGVSVALALHERGIETRLYGRPFSLWLDHTLPNFSLRSDARSSGIHGGDPRLSFASWLQTAVPAKDVRAWLMRRIPGPMFRAYLRSVVEAMPVTAVDDHVKVLAQEGGAFRVRTAAGEEIRARRVVIATGIQNHTYLPPALRGLGRRVIHSWDADAVAAVRDANVLVVGGGQSAAEASLLLAPANRVTWLHRSRLDFFNEPLGLPTPVFYGAFVLSKQMRHLPVKARTAIGEPFLKPTIVPALRPRLRRADVRCVRGDVQDAGLERANGRVRAAAMKEAYDRIVACTGYRIGLRTLPFLSDGLQRSLATPFDQPVLDRHFESRVPGLYFVGGLAVHAHGAPQRFMFGSRAASEGVVQAVTA